MPPCSKCSSRAVTFIRYSGMHLCSRHFSEFVERRVRKELRRLFPKKKGLIIVALSGGKDSTVALHLLIDFLGKDPDMRIAAISVDEGIEGYRGESLGYAKRSCERHDIEHHVVLFSDMFATSMDTIASMEREAGTCAFCGAFRRYCLNSKARELGAVALATGLNLDDTAQSVLMNFVRGDIAKLARLGPHTRVQPGLVPRLSPLRLIPEKEVYLYAYLQGIGFHDGTCPYAGEAQRNRFRRILGELERESPGTRHAVLGSHVKLLPILEKMYPPARLSPCSRCKEPTIRQVCKVCELRDYLKKIEVKA